MNRKLIIIAGYLAAGKTTLSLKLSNELGIPVFCKDLLKIALSRSLPVNNRSESKRLSAATFDAIAFITERFMETGQALIIEANFVMAENHNQLREGDVLKELIKRYDYQALTFVLHGDVGILCKRFNEREKLPERGDANRAEAPYDCDLFAETVIPLGDFDIGGEIIKIDTTDFSAVDLDLYVETARRFVNSC
ncbi:MAG: ATP-binding protein [Lachnospiraceae bacterium]|nr:ATP-binding protein [Lachnospiraceae bacterium]